MSLEEFHLKVSSEGNHPKGSLKFCKLHFMAFKTIICASASAEVTEVRSRNRPSVMSQSEDVLAPPSETNSICSLSEHMEG